MSRLDQMRAQFQERHNMKSGLPRPTKSSIPASVTKSVAPPRVAGDVLDGHVTSNGVSSTPAQSRHENGGTGAVSKAVPKNGVLHLGATKLNGHSKAPSAPRTGGALVTMTTAQLRNLAISRQANGTSANTGASLNKPASKSVVPAPTKPSAPAQRRPLNSGPKKPIEQPPARSKPPELVRKTVATPLQPPVSPARRTLSASKPAAAPSKSTPTSRMASSVVKKLPAQKESPRAPPPAERPLGPNQERCDICGRGFDKDRIEKHRGICKKAASKKVKVFDATKMRTAGTEVEVYVKRGLHKKEVPVKKSNWRAKHEEFIAAVRQAKLVQDHLAAGGKLSDLPPPPPSSNPDYVPCPHCGRKFNEAAAERHIPRCKEVSSRKPASAAARKPSGYR